LKRNPKNIDVIFPFLNGEDLNTRPDQTSSRFVINFRDWSFEKASEYSECLDILTQRVMPEREIIIRNGKQIHEYDYWKFWDKRLDSYEMISSLSQIFVITLHTKYVAYAAVPVNQVFSHALCVIGLSDWATFVWDPLFGF